MRGLQPSVARYKEETLQGLWRRGMTKKTTEQPVVFFVRNIFHAGRCIMASIWASFWAGVCRGVAGLWVRFSQ